MISPLKNKTILITGGGGYLGSKLAEKIIDPSSTYYLLDQVFNPLSTRLALENENVVLIKSDITHLYELERSLTEVKPDLIFHFAAILDRSRDFSIFEKLYKVNVLGTLNLLEIFQNVPYQCFYFASTSEVYGSKNMVPFHEGQAPEALSPYSLTKLMAENIIRTYSDIHHKPWVIARIFNFFGEDMPESTFIPQLINAWKNGQEFKMTAGEQKRDYLYIDDLIYYLANLAQNPDCKNEIINICSGNSLTMKEIAEMIKKLSGGSLKISATLPYRENELWDNTGSNQKLMSFVPERKLVLFENWIKEFLL